MRVGRRGCAAGHGGGAGAAEVRARPAGAIRRDGDPDLVIELPIEWKVDAEGEMPNFNLYTPLPFNEARFVGGDAGAAGQRRGDAPHHDRVAEHAAGARCSGTGPAWPGGPVNRLRAGGGREGR